MLPLQRKIYPLIALIILVGCTTKLTNNQRVLWGLNVYQAQYNMYLDQILDPSVTAEERAKFSAEPSLITDDKMRQDISEDQWEVLRVKKEILIELKPLVVIAASLTETGQIPAVDLQNEMTRLLNRLIEIGD